MSSPVEHDSPGETETEWTDATISSKTGDDSGIEEASGTSSEFKEKNKIGYVGCTSYVLGNVIGAGIFIVPSAVTAGVGSIGMTLLVWVICGLISLLGSVVYIELGTAIQEPGCDFAYMCHVGWKAIAFAFMWIGVLLSFPAAIAVQVTTFGQYVVDGLSPAIRFAPPYDTMMAWSLGATFLLLTMWINFQSLGRIVSIFQFVATVAKLLAMALIVVAGFYLLIFQGKTENFRNPFKGTEFKLDRVIMGFYACLYSYSGWDVLNFSVGEIKKPAKNMPLALLTGMTLVIMLFVTINVAYFVALDVNEVKRSETIGALFSQKVFGNFSYAVPFMIALLMCGTLNSSLFCASRYMFAAAREGHLPPFLSGIHDETSSPRPSIFLTTLLSLLMTFISVPMLIDYVSYVIIAQKLVGTFVLVWIRYKNIPVNKGVVRIPIALTVLFLIISTLLFAIPTISNFLTALVGFGITAIGLVIYYLFVKSERLPDRIQVINDYLTRQTMRLFNCKTDLKFDESIEKKMPLKSSEEC